MKSPDLEFDDNDDDDDKDDDDGTDRCDDACPSLTAPETSSLLLDVEVSRKREVTVVGKS